MLLTKAWFPLRPHLGQSQLYRCQDRLVAVRAGRRSGKTVIAKRKLVRMLPQAMWHGNPFRGLYLTPTRDQSKRIAWDDLKALVHPKYLAEPPRETELIIRTIWGSEIHLGGFDKPERFEGSPWDFVVVDESADIKPRAVDLSLRPAVADRQGTIWRIGVPKRVGVGATEFKQICEDKRKGYRYFGWSAESILPPDEIARLASELDAKDFLEQIRGENVTAGGRAFHAFDPKENISVIGTAYNPNRVIVVGSDFNVNPMAWVLCHVYNNCVYVFDEIWLRDTNTRATLDELHRRYGRHRAGFVFYGDATGQARKTSGTVASQSDYLIIKHDRRFINTKENSGVEVRYPRKNPRIKDRLASCNAMLCTMSGLRRLFVSPSCTHTIQDLDSRALDDSGQPKDATQDAGHITDALGYVVHGLFPIRMSDLDENEIADQLPITFEPLNSPVNTANMSFGIIG